MKKLFLGMFAFLLVLSSLQAQDEKAAKKALNAFNLDQAAKDKLAEAVAAVDADPTGEAANEASFWLVKGDVMNTVASQIAIIRQTGIGSTDDLPEVEMPAVEALRAYKKALEVANMAKKPKKYEIKSALKGIGASQSNLYNLGIFAYEDGDFETAYQNFVGALNAHDILTQNNETTMLDDESKVMDQKYLTGLAALNAKHTAAATPYFEELYAADYDKAAIYEALYTIKSAGKEKDGLSDAYQYLQAGREKYPEEVSLLFAEINHFLKIGKLNELISKLEMAIEKEPDNLTLYVTMGSVYDNLFQSSFKEGNMEKANEYFDKALEYYDKTLEKDPKDFDAVYSMGALYYNRAANMTTELVELEKDFSKEGIKKYEAKKADIFQEFDKALPFFQRAEKIRPNDVNTLIALKEIYARKDQLDMSNEFKTRLEKVQGGGKNDKSYFQDK